MVLVGGYFLLTQYQAMRIRRDALAMVEKLQREGDPDRALLHLDQYLQSNKPDIETQALRANLMDREGLAPGRILEVARVHEQIVRDDPKGKAGQTSRRRLVELYVRFGEVVKLNAAYYQIPAEVAALQNRYQAAEVHARELLRRDPTDPVAHRLMGMAMEGTAVPGKPEAFDQAIREYRVALQGDPTDIESGERLSRLYQVRLKDMARSERVLDDLLKALPGSVRVRLARHRFYVSARHDAQAAAELDAAAKIAPEDLSVLLASVEDSLRRGDTEGTAPVWPGSRNRSTTTSG